MNEKSMSLFDRLEQARSGFVASEDNKKSNATSPVLSNTATKDKYADLKKQIQNDVIEHINGLSIQESEKLNLRETIQSAVNKHGLDIPRSDRLRIMDDIYNDVVGLGPLETLMTDPSITEIMVNSASDIYIERNGRLELANIRFEDDAHILRVIDRIVSQVGRRCDESNPMVDARLKDGSRVNAVIPPIALKGPCITIRRFNASPLQVSDLVQGNSLGERFLIRVCHQEMRKERLIERSFLTFRLSVCGVLLK